MTIVEQIAEILNQMGIETVHNSNIGRSGYYFSYKNLIIWNVGNDDPNFIELLLLEVFDVSTRNRHLILEIINEFNSEYKYVKAIIRNDKICLSIEQVKGISINKQLVIAYLEYLCAAWYVLGDLLIHEVMTKK